MVVHSAGTAETLTLSQLAAPFTAGAGCSQAGGNSGPAACTGRESGSGIRDGFEATAGVENRRVLAQELTAAGAVLETVRQNPQATGCASLSAAEGPPGIRILFIDRVPCPEASVRSGGYPLQRPYLFVIGGPPSGATLPTVIPVLSIMIPPPAAGVTGSALAGNTGRPPRLWGPAGGGPFGPWRRPAPPREDRTC